MYTIEFRGKHQHKKPNLTNNIKESCHNIKSLTIDYDDVERIRYCDFSKTDSPISMLGGFVNGAQRLHKKNLAKQITILNDSDLNEAYIYAILNCDWMLSSEDTDYDTLLLESADELDRLYKRLNTEHDSKMCQRIQNRIVLIEYRMEQLANKRVEKETEEKTDNGNTLIFSANPANRRAKQ